MVFGTETISTICIVCKHVYFHAQIWLFYFLKAKRMLLNYCFWIFFFPKQILLDIFFFSKQILLDIFSKTDSIGYFFQNKIF